MFVFVMISIRRLVVDDGRLFELIEDVERLRQRGKRARCRWFRSFQRSWPGVARFGVFVLTEIRIFDIIGHDGTIAAVRTCHGEWTVGQEEVVVVLVLIVADEHVDGDVLGQIIVQVGRRVHLS